MGDMGLCTRFSCVSVKSKIGAARFGLAPWAATHGMVETLKLRVHLSEIPYVNYVFLQHCETYYDACKISDTESGAFS